MEQNKLPKGGLLYGYGKWHRRRRYLSISEEPGKKCYRIQGHSTPLKGPYSSNGSCFLKEKDLFSKPEKLRIWRTGTKKDRLNVPLSSGE